MTSTALNEVQSGDPQAIGTVINRWLQKKGISASVTLDQGELDIMLDGKDVPPESAADYVCKGVQSLHVEPAYDLHVYGRRLGEPFATWCHDYHLKPRPFELVQSSTHKQVVTHFATNSRSTVGWQEVVAVLFGILGGGAYCIFCKQPTPKKGVVLLISLVFGTTVSAITSFQPVSSTGSSTRQETTENVPKPDSPSVSDRSRSSEQPSSQSEVTTDCSYGVCTTTHTSPNGDLDIYSSGYGQSYDVHSRSDVSDGQVTVESWDSEGNSYKVESYCDSKGCYSSDSEGNSCTILSDGTMIGCD